MYWSQGSNRGGVTWGCVFFRRNFEKMCLFLHSFLAWFWKIDPIKTRFFDDSRGVSGKIFNEVFRKNLNLNIFFIIDFYCNFILLFSTICPKFYKTMLWGESFHPAFDTAILPKTSIFMWFIAFHVFRSSNIR